MEHLFKRRPTRSEITQVYAVGVTFLYTWTSVKTAKDFASNWSLYLSAADIASLFAYMMTFAFIESLMVIAALLFVYFILPQKITKNRFVLHGTILSAAFLGSMMIYYSNYESFERIETWALWFAASALTLMVFGETIPAVRQIIETVADRCVVFLYIYLPISLISLIVVALRNIGALL